ncbi:MAG: glycosyltransferase family 39 protein [Acidobacteria bacterium]|nr:glycosyltransferase family 39 protein [Acidobacteriota bacterium]
MQPDAPIETFPSGGKTDKAGEPAAGCAGNSAGSARRREWLAVWCLWAIFLLRALTYVSITPLWEGFDEPFHFAYIQHIVEQGRLPVQKQDTVSREIHHSLRHLPLPREPGGFRVGKVHDDWWRMPEAERREAVRRAMASPPSWSGVASDTGSNPLYIYQAQHGPLYYALAAIPYLVFRNGDLAERVFAVRLFSILLASVVVLAGYAIFRRVFGDPSLARVLTAVVAFMPGLMTDTCRVGNDSLSVAILSLAIALVVRESPWTWRRTVLLGLLAAAGLLTKLYFMAVLPAFVVVLGARFLRRPRNVGAFLAHTAVFLALAVSVSAWWYARNHRLYGAVTGLQLVVGDQRVTPVDVLCHIPGLDWPDTVKTTLFSHIWFGNWSFLVLRLWIYQLFALLYLAAAVGAVIRLCVRYGPVRRLLERGGRSLARRLAPGAADASRGGLRARIAAAAGRRAPGPPPAATGGTDTIFPPHSLTLLSFYFWFNAGILYLASLLDLLYGASGVPGWYVYTAVIPETAWLFLGLWLWYPPAWKRRVAGFLLACFSLLDVYGLFFILVPYYTGLTSHDATGKMDAFKPFGVHAGALHEIPSRLATAKPAFMGEGYFVVLAVCFFALTAVALVLAFRWMIRRPPRAAAPGWRDPRDG